jgi:hypothetical protein
VALASRITRGCSGRLGMEFNPYLVTLDMSSFADDTMMDDQRSARSRDAVQPRTVHDSTHHPASRGPMSGNGSAHTRHEEGSNLYQRVERHPGCKTVYDFFPLKVVWGRYRPLHMGFLAAWRVENMGGAERPPAQSGIKRHRPSQFGI